MPRYQACQNCAWWSPTLECKRRTLTVQNKKALEDFNLRCYKWKYSSKDYITKYWKFTFGKHQGVCFRSVPDQYIRWCYRNIKWFREKLRKNPHLGPYYEEWVDSEYTLKDECGECAPFFDPHGCCPDESFFD